MCIKLCVERRSVAKSQRWLRCESEALRQGTQTAEIERNKSGVARVSEKVKFTRIPVGSRRRTEAQVLEFRPSRRGYDAQAEYPWA